MIKTKFPPPVQFLSLYRWAPSLPRKSLSERMVGSSICLLAKPCRAFAQQTRVYGDWKQLLCLCGLIMVFSCWGFPKQMKCYSSKRAPSPTFCCWKYYKVRWKETRNPSSSQWGFTCLFRFPVCSKCSARESPFRLQECLTHIKKSLRCI